MVKPGSGEVFCLSSCDGVKCCPTYHIFTSGRRVGGDREPWMPREVFGLPSILPLPRVYPPLTSHFPPHYQHPPTHSTKLAVSSRLHLLRFLIEYVASSSPSLLPRLPPCLVRTGPSISRQSTGEGHCRLF